MMVSDKEPSLRYGHTEGRTEVCFDVSGKRFMSCGLDGEIRIWKGIDDDDPETITAGEKVYSIAVKGESLYVASDNNSVDCYKLEDGSPDGILVRFTGNATSLSVAESKTYVAAGSCDFEIKVIHLGTKKQKCYLGHQAPILSVALDPNDEYLASTSCDGKLKIWDLSTEECVKTIEVIPSSNDVGNSLSLAKCCWRPATGEDIAVAIVDGVKIFSRTTWKLFHHFRTDATSKVFQCCNFSPCGRFIAGSTVDGWIIIWDAETRECLRKWQHPLKTCISSLVWDPRENNSIAFSDTRGQVGLFEKVIRSDESSQKTRDPNDLDALFEEEDDNMMVDLMAEEDDGHDLDEAGQLPKIKHKAKKNVFLSDDDDSNPSMKPMPQNSNIPVIPSTLEILGDKDGFDDDFLLPTIPPTLPSRQSDADDDASSVATGAGALPSHHAQASPMQPAFQPGSTPAHLSHRFMVWNTVGIVRSYNDDTEVAIDVEFHDAQTHHPLHVPNHERFIIADLSMKALVLASEPYEDIPSKIKCIHFSSWDSNKEWTLNMPDSEEVKALTIGEHWIAVCTDAMTVRLLSLGGTQRQLFSIPGQVVAMAADTDQLLICYHVTQGFAKNQCLGFMLLEVGSEIGSKPRSIIGGQPLPISPGSTLTWLGFTTDSTPASVDSLGSVRLVNRSFCNTWTQVANTKKMTKSRHDNYWVVGLQENPQQILCILCKGAPYPSTLPRPTVSIHQYSLPFCEMDSDKTKLEEEYWRTKIFSSHFDYFTSRGYETDAEAKQKSSLEMQHVLMRLFALCCKTEHEYQAYEIATMMPTSASVNLAIKYASRIRRIMLAQRLQEVAQEKLAEETKAVAVAEDDSDDGGETVEEIDYKAELQAGYNSTATEWSTAHVQSSVTRRETPHDDDVEVTSSPPSENPEMKPKPTRSLSSQLAGSRKNPFKKSSDSCSTPTTSSTPLLDEMKRPTPSLLRKTPMTSTDVTKKMRGKDVNKKSKKSSQATLQFKMTSTPKAKKSVSRITENNSENSSSVDGEVLKEKSNGRENIGRKNGVHLFIEEKLGDIQEENPEINGIEARKMAIKMFRSLTAEEKKEWGERASQPTDVSSATKRKREADDDVIENVAPTDNVVSSAVEISVAKSQKLETSDLAGGNAKSKLSSYAFSVDG